VAGKRRENREMREKLGKKIYVALLRQIKRKLLSVRFSRVVSNPIRISGVYLVLLDLAESIHFEGKFGHCFLISKFEFGFRNTFLWIAHG